MVSEENSLLPAGAGKRWAGLSEPMLPLFLGTELELHLHSLDMKCLFHEIQGQKKWEGGTETFFLRSGFLQAAGSVDRHSLVGWEAQTRGHHQGSPFSSRPGLNHCV